MKKVRALIDGLSVELNVVETPEEYREGARASGKSLQESEGYVFSYEVPQVLGFENTGVPFDLRVLYLLEITTSPNAEVSNQGVVLSFQDMQKDSSKIVSQPNSRYTMAIELRKDFCEKNKIGTGSLVSFYEDTD